MKEKRLNIGLLIDDFDHYFSSQACKGAELAAKALDANLFIFPGHYVGKPDSMYFDKEFEYQYNTLFALPSIRNVDIIYVVLGTICSRADIEMQKEFINSFPDIPVVCLFSNYEGLPSVTFDNKTGLERAVEHLIEKHGAREIGFVSGPLTNRDARERLEVFTNVLKKHDIPVEKSKIAYGDFTENSTEEVNKLIEKNGTLDAIENILRGRTREVQVTAPYGEKIPARYYVIDGQNAVIESALASGLALCDADALDPLHATSRGTGELIMRALREGAQEVCIGLGGSATNDCGIGAASALGVRFLDEEGNEIDTADRMAEVARIDASGVDPLVRNAGFTLMCDVKRVSAFHGAGAAGGMGAMFMALLYARVRSGAEAVLDLASFDKVCKNASFVVTGEGRVDSTSVSGKALGTVLDRARACGVRTAIIAGSRGDGAELAEAKADIVRYCGEEADRVEALKKSARMLARDIGADLNK